MSKFKSNTFNLSHKTEYDKYGNSTIKFKFKQNDDTLYTAPHKGMDDKGNIIDIEHKFTGDITNKLKAANIRNRPQRWIDKQIDNIINLLTKLKSNKCVIACDGKSEKFSFNNIVDDYDKFNTKLPLSERIYFYLRGIKLLTPIMDKYDKTQFSHTPLIEYKIPYPHFKNFKTHNEWITACREWQTDYNAFRRDNNTMARIIDYTQSDIDDVTWLPNQSELPEGFEFPDEDDGGIRTEITTSDDGIVTSTVYFNEDQPLHKHQTTITMHVDPETLDKINKQVNRPPTESDPFDESDGWVANPFIEKPEIGYDLDD